MDSIEKLKVLDLFSGIGGFSLGLERTGGFETVAFCEIEPFCQKVLKKHWPDVEVYEDVRTLDYRGTVDVICGGYPCQPFSTAGKRKGAEDDRHLWPSMFSLIQKHRPSWVIGENVAGHISMGIDQVLSDLEGAAYTARTFVIPACAVDAPHRRDRVWIVANSNRCYDLRKSEEDAGAGGKERLQERDINWKPSLTSEVCAKDVAYAECEGLEGGQKTGNLKGKRQKRNKQPAGLCERTKWRNWPTESNVGRVADGIPKRVDRLRALGNAVVPQIPEMIGYAILEAENGFRD